MFIYFDIYCYVWTLTSLEILVSNLHDTDFQNIAKRYQDKNNLSR